MRPQVLEGNTVKIKTGCGNMYLTMNKDNDSQLMEVLITIGKAGGCVASLSQGLANLINITLRYKAPLAEIIGVLEGLSCYKTREGITSCCDGIAKGLNENINTE